MGALGLRCRDVRTREAGIQDIHHGVSSALRLGALTDSDSFSGIP